MTATSGDTASADRGMKAFDFLADTVKQAIALATGVLVFSITFLKDFIANASAPAKVVLGFAWFFFFISVVGGLWTLYALTGSVDQTSRLDRSIYDSNVRIPTAVQFVCLLLAILLTFVFGVIALTGGVFPTHPATSPSPSPTHVP